MKHFNKLLLLSMMSLWFSGAAMAQIIYVDASKTSGANTGATWNDAYTSLQSALADAATGTTKVIWVAKGTYQPSAAPAGLSISSGTKDYTFLLPEGVQLYGGFAGNEAPAYDLNSRNFVANETILSGDLNGNDDESNLATKTDNVYHVVAMVGHATNKFVLDGFTIQKGYAGDANTTTIGTNGYSSYGGAGIYIREAGGTLKNLNIKNNITNANVGAKAYGSIFISGTKKNVIDNVYFFKNSVTNAFNSSAEGYGGALSVVNTEVEIKNNTLFEDNFAKTSGGAIYVLGNSTAVKGIVKIDGAIFKDNVADKSHGGAAYFDSYAETDSKNVIFNNNSTNTGSGAAIYSKVNTGSTVTTHKIANAIFSNNVAKTSGGAITISDYTTIEATNVTFYKNKATTDGGAFRLTASNSVLKLYNSILNANIGQIPTVADISNGGGTVDVQYTITQQYGTDGVNGVQKGAVPLFLSTTYGNTDFLKLQPVSSNPAIDAGKDSFISGVNTDLAGVNRLNGTVDLGPYENQTVLPIKLANLSAKANGSSIVVNWATETETNNSHFILEKSTDGLNFNLIANVSSKGNGATYNHTDFSPANGNNYYRLTQIDNNGTKVTYDPVVVNFGLRTSDTGLKVYPNPVVANKVTVSFTPQKYTGLQLVNLYGQKLQSLNLAATDTEKTIDVSAYSSGTYLILLTNGTIKVSKKIVKP